MTGIFSICGLVNAEMNVEAEVLLWRIKEHTRVVKGSSWCNLGKRQSTPGGKLSFLCLPPSLSVAFLALGTLPAQSSLDVLGSSISPSINFFTKKGYLPNTGP